MKKFGDRKDGVRIRDLNGMNYINYQLKKKRCQSEVYINYSMDITKLVKYVEKINSNYFDVTYIKSNEKIKLHSIFIHKK